MSSRDLVQLSHAKHDAQPLSSEPVQCPIPTASNLLRGRAHQSQNAACSLVKNMANSFFDRFIPGRLRKERPVRPGAVPLGRSPHLFAGFRHGAFDGIEKLLVQVQRKLVHGCSTFLCCSMEIVVGIIQGHELQGAVGFRRLRCAPFHPH